MWTEAVLAVVTLGSALSASVEPGSQIKPTRGSPWPSPASLRQTENVFFIHPANFSFLLDGKTLCPVAESAVARYKDVLTKLLSSRRKEIGPRPKVLGVLGSMYITIRTQHCHNYPIPFVNESYEIVIRRDGARMIAESVWGVLRGLETFSQLAVSFNHPEYLMIRETVLQDYPRFGHRGLLIDTSRHFLPVPIILKMIEGLEVNKMNVLHWHMVDDQSFPYQSATYPELSKLGAYDAETMVYSEKDIARIVEFARLRGVRVIPEFDTPGHTRSWGVGRPELITRCYSGGRPTTSYGPIDPSRDSNYDILRKLFKEIVSRFQDEYIHLGGDEVDHSCWVSNPNVVDFMHSLNLTNPVQLEDYHMGRLFNMSRSLGFSTIVWQEPFERGVTLPKSTMVQVWLGNYKKLLKKVASAGYRPILSTCWYLDHVKRDLYGGGGDWRKFYDCEPTWDGATAEDEKKMAGGEACMWGEHVDETNVLSRVWPRASAAAERLWSPSLGPYPSPDAAAPRLEEHVCRMRLRGIPAQPANGPGFCI